MVMQSILFHGFPLVEWSCWFRRCPEPVFPPVPLEKPEENTTTSGKSTKTRFEGTETLHVNCHVIHTLGDVRLPNHRPLRPRSRTSSSVSGEAPVPGVCLLTHQALCYPLSEAFTCEMPKYASVRIVFIVVCICSIWSSMRGWGQKNGTSIAVFDV